MCQFFGHEWSDLDSQHVDSTRNKWELVSQQPTWALKPNSWIRSWRNGMLNKQEHGIHQQISSFNRNEWPTYGFYAFFDRCLETCCHRRVHFCSRAWLKWLSRTMRIWWDLASNGDVTGYHQHLWVITRNITRKLNRSTLNVASSGSSMIRNFSGVPVALNAPKKGWIGWMLPFRLCLWFIMSTAAGGILNM